jgi:hypothetical protein
VALPALVLLAALGVWVVLVGAAYLRCVDAAGVGARALSRGEPEATVRRVVAEVAPGGAEVTLGHEGDLVVVRVQARLEVPGGLGGGVTVGGRAAAVDESAVTGTAAPGEGP